MSRSARIAGTSTDLPIGTSAGRTAIGATANEAMRLSSGDSSLYFRNLGFRVARRMRRGDAFLGRPFVVAGAAVFERQACPG